MAVKNIWSKISIYCLNHETPLKMDVLQNTEAMRDAFYACENYATIPESQRKKGDKYCYNRIGLTDYQGIIYEFMSLMDKEGPVADLTNMGFKYPKKGGSRYEVKVLKYTEDEINLGVLNKSILVSKK